MPHPAAPHRRKLIVAAAATLAAALVLTGCATAPSHEPASPSTNSQAVDTGFLADHDLDGLDAAQVIERLDTMPVADRPTDLIASVQPDALVLTDDQKRETRLPMPEDEVYISVAPYREQTHDCYFHSLTTCLGELANTAVQVTLTGEDGDVLLDEVRQTYDNGFVGIWVPRGIKATLTIEHEGRTGTVTISTMNEDDATCITTLQLT
ncbi:MULTISPECIES: CueP family metal-binding protein [Microbacterium]|uniref:CueP family metal-binding protein n=1 Tax=Microbacterium TaxID=33882 RepID=UPI00187D2D6F|nr:MULTISPECIES: CueP family metal-binding protein [Microbacterium]MBE7954638.1 CueP family metal-binding protein [Microbacterium sp. R1]MCT2225731.1 CueP family metal-binding protein [Microbacterium paraoxydans]